MGGLNLQSVATRELGTMVERHTVAALLVELLQTLFDLLMHMVGMLRADLDDDRQPRLAIHQRHQAARAGWAEHGIAFEAELQPRARLVQATSSVPGGGGPLRCSGINQLCG